MEVAIIGSGISGLSCAFRLNQLGVKPTIFERRPILGEAVSLYGIHLNCFNHVSKNPLQYFKKKYNLIIEPMCPLKKLIMYSNNKKVTVKGRLGYIFNRGAESASLESQLFNQVDANFYFDTYIFDELLGDIRKQFDAVVIASGCIDFPDYLGVVERASLVLVRSGILDGRFKTGQVTSWMKTQYSKNSFVYLIPVSETRAVITLTVDNVTPNELDYLWKQMILTEDVNNTILETWDCEYHGGRLKANQLGNVYFTGNAGGLTDDFMGFGIVNAMASGIFAANAIVKGVSYEESIKQVLKCVDQIHNLRMLANRTDKNSWKYMTQLVGVAGMRNIIYKSSLLQFHHIGSIIGRFLIKK